MKVLLFGNIGTDKLGYYHVGDEAMFQAVYHFYHKYLPSVKLGTLVSSSLYKNSKLDERLDIPWPEDVISARLYFYKLIFKSYLLKYFKISLFSPAQQQFVRFVRSHNLIHLFGGGYLTSECGGWMYYGLLMIKLGSIFRIRTILTSHTIGPFNNMVDRQISRSVLNTASYISLRTESDLQTDDLIKQGIVNPSIFTSLDAAYFLETDTSLSHNFAKQRAVLRVGLSLHGTSKDIHLLQQLLITNLTKLSQKRKIEVMLLPHIIHEQIPWDLSFMQSVLSTLPSSIKVITPKYSSHSKDLSGIARMVKGLTSTCDIAISTRYHGVVFALSQSIPCLSIISNRYQVMKNSEALRFVFGENINPYLFSLHDQATVTNFARSLSILATNHKSVSSYISKQNQKLKKQNDKYLVDLAKLIMRDTIS